MRKENIRLRSEILGLKDLVTKTRFSSVPSVVDESDLVTKEMLDEKADETLEDLMLCDSALALAQAKLAAKDDEIATMDEVIAAKNEALAVKDEILAANDDKITFLEQLLASYGHGFSAD